jgi:heme-degrading monooxygenase HmoA
MRLKPNSVPEFTRKLEKDVIPLLHKQRGFKDELTFVSKGDREVVAISVWDREEDAEAYHSGGYPKVVTLLSNVVEGTIHVQGGEVSNSTFHRIAATAAVQ